MATILIELVGGLGLFIAGMNMMSHGIEKVAGNKLRGILQAFTKTKFLGLLVGLLFTAVIQSSSAATVMVVSFVNSGLLTLTEASGIILGANIGTTVTAMLVAIRMSLIAPIFVFAGAVMLNYVKNPTVKKIGEVVLGFGILFVGISTMSEAMGELREIPEVLDILANFTNPLLAVLMGLIITSIVQSSSVTVSILVVMASQGLVNLHICMFVILGCNIGACTSAVISGLSGNKNAKRASLIHLLFNVFGTILMFVLLIFFSDQIAGIITFISGNGNDAASLGRSIAMAHFLFKVFQVIVLYPFMNGIIKLTYILVPGEDVEVAGEDYHLQYISSALPNPAVAVVLAVQEIRRMARISFENLNLAVECLINDDLESSQRVFSNEKYVDYLDEQISNYLVKINHNALPFADINMIAAYFHVVSDIERVSDHAENIAELIPQIEENNIQFTDQSIDGLRQMMDLVNQILEKSIDMFVSDEENKSYENSERLREISRLESKIDEMERELQSQHILDLNEGKCSAQAGIYFSDIISALERVGDHAINIAFALADARNAAKIGVKTSETIG